MTTPFITTQNHSNSMKFPPRVSNPSIFLSVWDTEKISVGSSGNNQIRLPLLPESENGTYDFMVDWGDGIVQHITTSNYSAAIHTYSTYEIRYIIITGTIIGWQFGNGGDRLKIIQISQWGCLRVGNSGGYFHGCSNLEITAPDVLNLTGTTTLADAFNGCSKIGSNGNFNSWDVSKITNMSNLFFYALMFNQPLNSWNVSKVKDMKGMFRVANAFNQPIGNWDTSSVIDMSYMFSAATSFDTFIGGWNTSNVQNMDSMFAFAYYFNQEIGDWDTSNVVDMRWMFIQNYAFNRDLGNWNTSKVQIMQRMFYDARDFNQDLSAWNTSNVIDMSGMFALASSFNQNIGNWNVSNVSTMVEMLFNCGLSTANYDALLIGWSKLSLKYDVMLHTGNNIKYSPGEAASARNILIEVFNWSISDGGQIEEQPIDANPVNPSPLTQIQGDIYYYIIGTLLSLGIITSVVAFKRYSKKRTQKEPTQEPNFINATIKKPEIMTEPLTFQKYGSNICPFCASSIPKEDLHHLTEKNMNICQFCGKIIYFQ